MRNRRVIKLFYKPSDKQALEDALYEYKESQNYDENGDCIEEKNNELEDNAQFRESYIQAVYEMLGIGDENEEYKSELMIGNDYVIRKTKAVNEMFGFFDNECKYELTICNKYLICKIAGYNLAINTSFTESFLFNNEDDITINNHTYHFGDKFIDEELKTELEEMVGNRIDGLIGLDLMACETIAIVKTDKTHGYVCFGMEENYYKNIRSKNNIFIYIKTTKL